MWSRGPEQKVFIDGRGDVYERGGVLEDYLHISWLQPGALAILEQYGVRSCLVKRAEPLADGSRLIPGLEADLHRRCQCAICSHGTMEEITPAADRTQFPWRKLLPWLGLACILAAFVVEVVRLHPANLFGETEDDSIYFSSAKGIAGGQGYVLASFPGTPLATKYPVFYPWLLSWVWRWNPSFPSNLTGAIAISVAFGVLYIAFAFVFLRRFKDLSEAEALILTGFCALHPVVLLYGGSVLTEIPFAALSLGGMLVAEGLIESSPSALTATGCGVLVGFGMLTRAFGVPVAAGIGLALFAYRAWRPALFFCGSVAPFLTFLFWKTVSARAMVPPVSGAAASSLGWVHTWAYYTSYINVWKQGVPTVAAFVMMLKSNTLIFLVAPATYLLFPLVQPKTILGTVIVVVLAAVTLAGVFREARKNGFRPIHFVLPFYACVTVLWTYPDVSRFLIPFLPLFAAGIWLEGKYLLRMVSVAIASGAKSEKVLATALSALVIVFISLMMVNYFGAGRDSLTDLARRRGILLQEKRQAYDWISRFAPSDARLVAYEDATLYLYTGRLATRPFTFTTVEFRDHSLLEKDLDHMTDVPMAIGAQYWVFSDDDFGFETIEAYKKGHARMRILERDLPLVFRSHDNHVRVYFIGCLRTPMLSVVADDEFWPTKNACRGWSEPAGNLLAPSD